MLLATEIAEIPALYKAAYEGNLDVLLKVAVGEENLMTEEINGILLLATDNEGMTAWHWAACEGNLDIL